MSRLAYHIGDVPGEQVVGVVERYELKRCRVTRASSLQGLRHLLDPGARGHGIGALGAAASAALSEAFCGEVG